jgi:hypothetical protein
MGMISPIWEDAMDGPPSGITRIRLFLTHNMTHAINQSIMQQIEDIQATHLLFMRNIRCIKITCLDDEGVVTSSTRYSTRQITPNRISVTKEKDGSPEELANYHVTKHIARNLVRNENRKYSEAEEAARTWSSSEVVLAFPLDDSWSDPVIKSQQIFAFLPIRSMGFKVSHATPSWERT